jgi:hypothetical protein
MSKGGTPARLSHQDLSSDENCAAPSAGPAEDDDAQDSADESGDEYRLVCVPPPPAQRAARSVRLRLRLRLFLRLRLRLRLRVRIQICENICAWLHTFAQTKQEKRALVMAWERERASVSSPGTKGWEPPQTRNLILFL